MKQLYRKICTYFGLTYIGEDEGRHYAYKKIGRWGKYQEYDITEYLREYRPGTE